MSYIHVHNEAVAQQRAARLRLRGFVVSVVVLHKYNCILKIKDR